MLVDSHCHLDLPEFNDDIDDVIRRANASGVSTLLTICTQTVKFNHVRKIAERYSNVYCTVGTHPHEAKNESKLSVDELIRFANHPKVVGFGETGLDYFYENSPRDVQRHQFRTHIAAAREKNLPVIVHTRNADEDTAIILKDEYQKGPFAAVIHCFTGSQELARQVIEMGFYISLSGIVTYKNANELRDVIKKEVPIERLLVETDAPYLAPVPKRGKRNEPAYTIYTANYLAELLDISEKKFAAATTDNFFRLFSKTVREF